MSGGTAGAGGPGGGAPRPPRHEDHEHREDRPPAAGKDVVALLTGQHGVLRNLFDEVERTAGRDRADALHRLVRLFAVHETAEEEVVHPYARRVAEGGERIVADRLREEHAAKEALRTLERTDPSAAEFVPALRALRADFAAHARAEERYEFPQLRRLVDPAQLVTMARSVRAAEATAPTRPHPGSEGAAHNVAVGPLTAVADRVRDALREARHKKG